ncbi:MAG: hypothetical protein ACR2QC_03145 [Gammaproteobacteria bacterium]
MIAAVASLTLLLGWVWEAGVSAVAGQFRYSAERIYDPFVLDFWIRGLIDGALGAVVCFLVARKFGLKAWRLAVCGFVWWPLTVSILAAYPFVRRANKQNRYNYYALSLGLSFLVLYLFGMFIVWFFITKGATSWQ